jgi:hypothetical protein
MKSKYIQNLIGIFEFYIKLLFLFILLFCCINISAQGYKVKYFGTVRQLHCHGENVWVFTTPNILVYNSRDKLMKKMQYPDSGSYRYLRIKHGLDGNFYMLEKREGKKGKIYTYDGNALKLYYECNPAFDFDVGKHGEVYTSFKNSVEIYDPNSGEMSRLPVSEDADTSGKPIFVLSNGIVVFGNTVFYEGAWHKIKGSITFDKNTYQQRLDDSTILNVNAIYTCPIYALNKDSLIVSSFMDKINFSSNVNLRFKSNAKGDLAISQGCEIFSIFQDSKNPVYVYQQDCLYDIDTYGNLWYNAGTLPAIVRKSNISTDTLYFPSDEIYRLELREMWSASSKEISFTDYYGFLRWNPKSDLVERNAKIVFKKDSSLDFQPSDWHVMSHNSKGVLQFARAIPSEGTYGNTFFNIEVAENKIGKDFTTWTTKPLEKVSYPFWMMSSANGDISVVWSDTIAVEKNGIWVKRKIIPKIPEFQKQMGDPFTVDRRDNPCYYISTGNGLSLMAVERDGQWKTVPWEYSIGKQITFGPKNEFITSKGLNALFKIPKSGISTEIDVMSENGMVFYDLICADTMGNIWFIDESKLSWTRLSGGAVNVVVKDVSVGKPQELKASPDGKTIWVRGELGIGVYSDRISKGQFKCENGAYRSLNVCENPNSFIVPGRSNGNDLIKSRIIGGTWQTNDDSDVQIRLKFTGKKTGVIEKKVTQNSGCLCSSDTFIWYMNPFIIMTPHDTCVYRWDVTGLSYKNEKWAVLFSTPLQVNNSKAILNRKFYEVNGLGLLEDKWNNLKCKETFLQNTGSKK